MWRVRIPGEKDIIAWHRVLEPKHSERRHSFIQHSLQQGTKYIKDNRMRFLTVAERSYREKTKMTLRD